jgi:SAM-dependent methyltransferase
VGAGVGRLADPARRIVLDAAGVGAGTRALDVGCGSGEFLDMAAARGAEVCGLDASDAMLAAARWRLPGADLRVGPIEDLPWSDGDFDLVSAFNSVQFAADRARTVAEMARVARPGALVTVCSWAADAVHEVRAVEGALEALVPGSLQPPAEPRFGTPGVIEGLVEAAGLEITAVARVPVPFAVADEEALQLAFRLDAVRTGALEAAGDAASRAVIARSAAPFRRADGSYRFENVFRVVLARRPA